MEGEGFGHGRPQYKPKKKTIRFVGPPKKAPPIYGYHHLALRCKGFKDSVACGYRFFGNCEAGCMLIPKEFGGHHVRVQETTKGGYMGTVWES